MIDAIRQASENLCISHSFALYGGQIAKLNNEMGGSPSLDKNRIVCVTVFRKKLRLLNLRHCAFKTSKLLVILILVTR